MNKEYIDTCFAEAQKFAYRHMNAKSREDFLKMCDEVAGRSEDCFCTWLLVSVINGIVTANKVNAE